MLVSPSTLSLALIAATLFMHDLRAAASSAPEQPTAIADFPTQTKFVPNDIAALKICYLKHSLFDRLRVHPAVWTQQFFSLARKLEQEAYHSFTDCDEPIDVTQFASVTIGQILNANPYQTPSERAWLHFCSDQTGLTEELPNAALEKLHRAALIQNLKNIESAYKYLPYPGRKQHAAIEQLFSDKALDQGKPTGSCIQQ